MYNLSRDDFGGWNAINKLPGGETIPYWDEYAPLTQEFLAWLRSNTFDLTNRAAYSPSPCAEMTTIADITIAPPPPLPVPPPDWRSLRYGLLQSEAYNAIVFRCQNPTLVSRVESWAMQSSEDWNTLQILWNAMIAASPSPSTQEVAALNEIASAAYMPFSFNEGGVLIQD